MALSLYNHYVNAIQIPDAKNFLDATEVFCSADPIGTVLVGFKPPRTWSVRNQSLRDWK